MKRAPLYFIASLSIAGCAANISGGSRGDGGNQQSDGSRQGQFDLAGADLTPPPLNACGDNDPGCMTTTIGPPAQMFPLQSDPMPKPNETDNGLGRDPNGYLVLSSSNSNFNYVWAAGDMDYNIGSVSKVDSKTVKEVARYFTVTCYSNPTGSRAQCDGKNGCCARDDYADWQYRQGHGGTTSGVHQAINLSMNRPSRTAVDFNGDMWVSNRAFGTQSSVSKIANELSECTDRNGTPGIQTSSDVNADGIIDTDCNENGTPDDVADVKAQPCTNGKAQEFYGFDDECVLFTTNTNADNQYGRPLALGPGTVDFGPADAWAGGFQNGLFFRIDGTTGMTKSQAQVGASPYGATVDKFGFLWAAELASPTLYYFDTQNPAMSGTTRTSTVASGGYGITVDRDQNIWTGGYPTGNAARYVPDRSAGGNAFAKLGMGAWTIIQNPGQAGGANDISRGVAADSRTAQQFWVWLGRHPSQIVRIPGSSIPIPPPGTDSAVDGTNYLAITVAGTSPAGAGVDTDQNIWAISTGDSVATRIKVDVNGNPSAPDLTSGSPHTQCPAGDRCFMRFVHPSGKSNSEPAFYTYSDFTGFGLRNFTNPKGSYTWIQAGCSQQETHFLKVLWDGIVPANTKLTMRARAGQTPIPDATWSAWTPDFAMSPANIAGMVPDPIPYLQVEFDLSSMDFQSTPKLKDFTVVYKCGNKIG